MNYLAHLYLSEPDPESLIGSLMGDFAKGRIDAGLAPRVRDAIVLHRRIDAFTDAHAIVRHSKSRLDPAFRRYGGILVDVFYDHYLARHWNDYSTLPLVDFADAVYAVLRAGHRHLPDPMQRSMTYLRDNNLLCSYRETAGIEHALRGLERRLKRPSRLGEAVRELQREYDGFETDFRRFFPELIDFVAQQKRRLAAAADI